MATAGPLCARRDWGSGWHGARSRDQMGEDVDFLSLTKAGCFGFYLTRPHLGGGKGWGVQEGMVFEPWHHANMLPSKPTASRPAFPASVSAQVGIPFRPCFAPCPGFVFGRPAKVNQNVLAV